MSGQACPECRLFVQDGPAGGLADHLRVVHPDRLRHGELVRSRRSGLEPLAVHRSRIAAAGRRRAAAARSRKRQRGEL